MAKQDQLPDVDKGRVSAEERWRIITTRQKQKINQLEERIAELESGLRLEAMRFAVEVGRGQGLYETLKAFGKIFEALTATKEERKENSQWE